MATKSLAKPAHPGAPAAAAAPPAVSFMEASEEVTEHFGAQSIQMQAAAPVNVTDLKVPAFGFLRSILMIVTLTGGVDATPNAVMAQDGPWNVIQNLTLTEPNGRNIILPITGYHLYLANKWFPTSEWELQPEQSPLYSAPTTSGNCSFALRIPVELGGRDPLGALSNQQNDSRFRISYTVAPASTVYTTVPDTTLPTVNVEFILESWAPVTAATPEGAAVQVLPQYHGTLQNLSVQTPDVDDGEKQVPITRVGNLLRGVLFICRNAAGARADNVFPSYYRFSRDNNAKDVAPAGLLKHYMRQRTGIAPDTGVYVIFDGEHDLDGRVGQGLRTGWMRTSSATRLEVSGTWANTGSVQVLVNDVKPAPGMVQA